MAAAGTAPAAATSAAARSCGRFGASASSTARPAAAAPSAPRENVRYSARPSAGAQAAAAALRVAGRAGSPTRPAARISPSAANTPVAFQ